MADSPVGPPEVPEPFDPAFAVALATRHGLAARAGSRLEHAGAEWTSDLVRAWRRAAAEQALARDAAHELAAGALRGAIPLVALKGLDLATRLYAPGERTSNDIDLLVPPACVDDVARLLGAAGFAPDHPDPAWARTHWFATTFRHRERPRLQVDLHWSLGPSGRTRWRVEDVCRRAEPFPGVPGLLRLDAIDLVSHLALHAVAFHAAAGRWVWWLDLQLLFASLAGRESEIAARGREVGAGVALAASRLRVVELFGGDAPSAGWRARAAAAIGRRAEDRDHGRLARWPVAALSVDRPLGLWRTAAEVAARRSPARAR